MSSDETSIWMNAFNSLLARAEYATSPADKNESAIVNRCADAADEAVRRYRARTGQPKKEL